MAVYSKITEDQVIEGAKTFANMTSMLESWGHSRHNTKLRYHIKQMMATLGVSFTGTVGKVVRLGSKTKRPLSEVLTLTTEGPYPYSHPLKKRLIEEGVLENRCSDPTCPNPEPMWKGEPLSLHLDHIDGNPRNNLIENLRILCPNCHSQTETYCGKGQLGKSALMETFDMSKEEIAEEVLKSSINGVAAKYNVSWEVVDRYIRGVIDKPTYVQKTKISWPSDEDLLNMLRNSTYSEVGRNLGVSDNAIRKRMWVRGLST